MANQNAVSELDFEGLLSREWLIGNGLGGYASSTLTSLNTRRYHGLLVAAMSAPVRQMVLLSRVEEIIRCDGREFELACNEYPGVVWPTGHEHLRAFSTEPHPRWAYQADGWTLQKELRLVPGHNAVVISYALLGGGNGVELAVRPLLALRGIHELSYQWNGKLVAQKRSPGHWRVPATRRTPEVFFAHNGDFEARAHWYLNHIYRREAENGYAGLEDLWSPGVCNMHLTPGQTVHFACSADPFELPLLLAALNRSSTATPVPPAKARADESLHTLIEATACHVLVAPDGQSLGAAADYHWSPPSVRSAMVGISGLYLIPGRLEQARSMLVKLAGQQQGGLLPADLPTDGSNPVRRGADVPLWYVNAVRQYLLYGGDDETVQRQLLPAVMSIIESFKRGTADGIATGADALLSCGSAERAATWMDNTVDGRPITPRHGRPVEINALWYNALLSAAELCRRFDRPADAAHLSSLAQRVEYAFNEQFWNAESDCCFDVVGKGANDAAIRPNQLFAISLAFPVLRQARWEAVIAKVAQSLLTPVGLRTLSPADSRYEQCYRGPLCDRNRAAHNGSVYPWLLGPFVTAAARAGVPMSQLDPRQLLAPSIERLRGQGMNHLVELFDGDAPHNAGGAIASALSVAEVLRSYVEDVLGNRPPALAPRSSTQLRLPASSEPRQPV